MGEAKSLVEGVKGTVEAITNLDETVATLANILQDPKGTFDKVVISAEQWNKQLNWALENDPVLAAEMQGYMVGAGKSLEMPSLLLTGEAAKVFQKVAKNNTVERISISNTENATDFKIKVPKAITEKEQVKDIITKTLPILKQDGYYYANGMKISEKYYDKLWRVGRPAPFIQAREILNSNPKILPDNRGKDGFYRYESSGLEMIYNPVTKEIWHIQPINK